MFEDNVNNANPEAYKKNNLNVSMTNICSEISLYTDELHSFICCLSSLNLARWDEWNEYKFKWTCGWSEWSNSSTLKIIIKEKEYALLEFQFHTKNRTNMAIRWCYENFLTIFKENLCIIDF